MNKLKQKFCIVADGGGVRGVFTCGYIEQLEKFIVEKGYGDKITDVFDSFVGTSTGSMIASLLASGKYTGEDLCNKIATNENMGRIFSKRQNVLKNRFLLNPKYYNNPLNELCHEYLDDLKMFDLPNSLMIVTYNLRERKPTFWTNYIKSYNPKVADVILASAAAPTFFPAYRIFFGREKFGEELDLNEGDDIHEMISKPVSGDGYIDGGVVCNSPSTIAIAFQNKIKNKHKILCVGTGSDRNPINFKKAQNAGGFWWLLKGGLLSIAMDGPDQVNQIESELLDAEDYLRIQLGSFANLEELSLEMDNTNPKNLDRLRDLGRETFFEYKKDLEILFKEL